VNFLAPGFLWLMALAAPVVLLYFFRQKQQDRVVPTNFLWAQALQDTRTAAVLRRFLRSLLLLLQLLFLALLVLALAGATASLWTTGSSRLVVAVLDRSASMGAKDGAGGATRLDQAKASLRVAIEGLREGDRMMLLAVDERAEVLVPFTGEHDRLLGALDAVVPRDLGTDLAEAAVLLKAQGAAAAGRDVEVLVLSDGAFADPGGIEGMRISYVPFGEAKDNAGITDLRVSRGSDGAPSLAVAAEAFGSVPLKRTLSLRLGEDGRVLDARAAEAPAGQQAFVLFPLDAVPPGPLEVRLEGEDALAADDRAFLVHRPEPPRRYAVFGQPSRWLRDPSVFRATLEGSPTPVADAAALAAAGPLDLLICNGSAPSPMPAVRAAIFIGCVPPDGPVTAAGALEYPPVIDWSRTHPITRHCEFSDLLVVEALRLQGVPPAGVLVDSPQGPLLAFVETPDRQSLFLPFDLDKSNLPLRLAFPLLLPNAMDHFFSSRRPGDDEEFLRTGRPLERSLPPAAEMTVTPPGGKPATVVAGAGGTAVFRDTGRAGLYAVETPKGKGFAAASLVRRAESDIAPRSRVEAGGVVHEADPESVKTNVPLRDTLLLLAVGILLLEWLLWTRRR
jgi:hypothetical protein